MGIVHAVLTKQFTFRGKPERFSNGYWLVSDTLDGNNATQMSDLVASLITVERALHSNVVSWVYANAGAKGAHASYVQEFGTPLVGTLAYVAQHPERCILAKAKLGQRHYVMKWYHTMAYAPGAGAGQADIVGAADQTAINTQLAKLTDGTTLTAAAKVCNPAGVVTPFQVDTYFRTHQLKARGKRNPPTP
jgi:hypothetical protein